MDWFLYDNGLRHERVKFLLFSITFLNFDLMRTMLAVSYRKLARK